MSARTPRSLLLGAPLLLTLCGFGSCSSFVKPQPPTGIEVSCPPIAYQYAEGPTEPKGVSMEETEVEDSINRARWGRDIVRLNSAVSCLRQRDAGHLPVK